MAKYSVCDTRDLSGSLTTCRFMRVKARSVCLPQGVVMATAGRGAWLGKIGHDMTYFAHQITVHRATNTWETAVFHDALLMKVHGI